MNFFLFNSCDLGLCRPLLCGEQPSNPRTFGSVRDSGHFPQCLNPAVGINTKKVFAVEKVNRADASGYISVEKGV